MKNTQQSLSHYHTIGERPSKKLKPLINFMYIVNNSNHLSLQMKHLQMGQCSLTM